MHSVTKEDIINSNHRIISTHTIEDLRCLTFIERVRFKGFSYSDDIEELADDTSEELAVYTIVLCNGYEIETYIRPVRN
ncbi:MAG: hypothetical protein UH654_11420 [Lachnospiraceae bacterium]|uniref:hypothetical protein n=1 Tax=Falcatimonas sp. MSJ-15 TaxID=2841515 RepID=UPI001C0FCB5E|nr:hypothetical protein [Falcatimonas sp. MSJ-15]MBU5470946.1 hypothetical protein [Falcatimonas sp. MSJ-15]MEE0960618.1 hypothetical protein [Lachnospiraceae bacterium]